MPAIDVFDGAAGTFIGTMDCSNLSVGTFRLDQIGVADDGAIYGANLSTSVGSTTFKIYRWSAWTDTNPATCFVGDPTSGNFSGGRMGDTLALRGAGTNTLILAEVGSGTTPTTNIVLFSTVDGTNFTPTLLQISGLPGLTGGNGPAFGYAFYTNNTFIFKANGSSAYLVQYPANFASLTSPVAATVLATNSFSGNNVLISFNPAAGLLGAVGPMLNSGPALLPLTLYSLPTFAGLATLASTNTPHTNGNGNFVGGAALGGSRENQFPLCPGLQQRRASRADHLHGCARSAVHCDRAGGRYHLHERSVVYFDRRCPRVPAFDVSMAIQHRQQSRDGHEHSGRHQRFLYSDLSAHQCLRLV
jgi:hypothetical protein